MNLFWVKPHKFAQMQNENDGAVVAAMNHILLFSGDFGSPTSVFGHPFWGCQN